MSEFLDVSERYFDEVWADEPDAGLPPDAEFGEDSDWHHRLLEPVAEFASLDAARLEPTDGAGHDLRIVALDEFVAVEEPGANALLGDGENALIAEGSDVMFYGDGGAGKTTLAVDLGCHLAAGDPWLGIPVARPVNVVVIENEGPRPHFRVKLRRKRDGWAGSALGDRIRVLAEPWSWLTLAERSHREALAAMLRELETDVVILGPVTRLGMDEAGTLQQVRDYTTLLAEVRGIAGRPVTFVLIHHENKGGKVSGAWEGSGDTLLHVQAQGHGSTRLYIQKSRWSSSHHATTLQLAWTAVDGFSLVDEPERDDNTIADELLKAVRANGGASWNKIDDCTAGKGERKRAIRDRLLLARRLINAGGKGGMKLWHVDDPARPADQEQLRPEGDALGDAPASNTGGEGAAASTASLRPCVIGTQDAGTHPGPPAESDRSASRVGDALVDESQPDAVANEDGGLAWR